MSKATERLRRRLVTAGQHLTKIDRELVVAALEDIEHRLSLLERDKDAREGRD